MKTLILAITAALVLAGPVAAQDADSVRELLSRRGVCRGAVQIATAAERLRGGCRQEDERLVVRTVEGERRDVPYAAVDSVWVRSRGTGSGASVGAVVGVVLVGGAALLLADGFCEGSGDCGGVQLFGGLGGAALGGSIGAFIGESLGSRRAWIRLYP